MGTPHQVMVSSRWNPTPEQLRALEELYRHGTRTPSAEQIQHITSQLRCYGKIEGKNVFYWFQNHKARERQKRRRQLHLPPPPPLPPPSGSSGGNKIGFEVGQKSYKRSPSTTNKQESDPPIKITETGITKAETSTSDGWIQFHETPEFQHHHHSNNQNNVIIISNNNNNNNNITVRDLLFAGERNATWDTHQNIIMVQPNTSCSCCYLQTSPSPIIPFSVSSQKPNSSIIVRNDLNQSSEKSVHDHDQRPASPTLRLFPLLGEDYDQDNQNGVNDDDRNVVEIMDDDNKDDGDEEEEEERKNENSSLARTINNEKATAGLPINSNNPFPYYQFL